MKSRKLFWIEKKVINILPLHTLLKIYLKTNNKNLKDYIDSLMETVE